MLTWTGRPRCGSRRCLTTALRSIAVSAAIVVGAGGTAHAAVTSVDCSLGGDLQAAIDGAAAGDTLEVSGTCVGDAVAPGSFEIDKDLTLQGIGAAPTLQGNGQRVVFIEGADPTVEIRDLTITGGTVPPGCGGGLLNTAGTVTLTNVTVRDNSAGCGGGLENVAVLNVVNSTVSGNLAGNAGGIGNDAGTLTLVNSTVTGNVAGGPGTSSAGAGGVGNLGTALIVHSTISGNSVIADTALGGGLVSTGHGRVTTLRATIIAGNTTSGDQLRDCWGGDVASEGHNLIGVHEQSCIPVPAATDLLGTAESPIDPLLGPLAANGGPTQTMALGASSPAIDAIPAEECTSSADQRGVARPQGAGCDIGSFERGGAVLPFLGFFSPVNNPPVLNSVEAGRAIPVKFSLGGDNGLDIFALGYPKSEETDCSATEVDGIESTVTAGASSLSYNAITDQYTYVWKTLKDWEGTCRQLVVKLTDDTSHRAHFMFK